jgi:hypothetical protein
MRLACDNPDCDLDEEPGDIRFIGFHKLCGRCYAHVQAMRILDALAVQVWANKEERDGA